MTTRTEPHRDANATSELPPKWLLAVVLVLMALLLLGGLVGS